jgi:hypothetical protein
VGFGSRKYRSTIDIGDTVALTDGRRTGFELDRGQLGVIRENRTTDLRP